MKTNNPDLMPKQRAALAFILLLVLAFPSDAALILYPLSRRRQQPSRTERRFWRAAMTVCLLFLAFILACFICNRDLFSGGWF